MLVSFIWHTFLLLYFFLDFNSCSPLKTDPGWDCGPFTILQNIHSHVLARPGCASIWTQSGNRSEAIYHHITAHCITSYRHTHIDLKSLVGVLCLLVKTQQKLCSAVLHPPEKPAKITETKGKNKKRDTSLAFSNFTNIVSLEIFNMYFYCFI